MKLDREQYFFILKPGGTLWISGKNGPKSQTLTVCNWATDNKSCLFIGQNTNTQLNLVAWKPCVF